MDDNSALSRDYLLTIESMKKEIASLKAKLNSNNDSDEANYDQLQETLEEDQQLIENLHGEITEKNSLLMDLKGEKEWILKEFPK